MPQPTGPQWDALGDIAEELEDYHGSDAKDAREDWIINSKYPHKYLNEVGDTEENGYDHYDVLQQRLKEANFPDQVQVTRRGTPVNKGQFRSGSVFPEWTGGSPTGHHYGRDNKLHISLVPREHIVGLGQEEEGEVFYKIPPK
jgi:hypothetical protein